MKNSEIVLIKKKRLYECRMGWKHIFQCSECFLTERELLINEYSSLHKRDSLNLLHCFKY